MDPLFTAARRGDVQAFEELLAPHLTPLYQLATAMVGAEEARDVTQEALLNAWSHLGSLKSPNRLESWLRSIVMNCARNVLRARRRRPAVSFDPTQGLAANLHHEPLSTLAGKLAVEDALARLGPDERAVLVLHYFVDLPLRSVAETLRMKEGTVKTRLHAGLTALRREFGEDHP